MPNSSATGGYLTPDGNPSPIKTYGNKFISVQTSGTDGAAWVAFESYACWNLSIVNNLDIELEFKRANGPGTITIPALQDYIFQGLSNSNQISVRRKDQSTTQVTVQGEAYS